MSYGFTCGSCDTHLETPYNGEPEAGIYAGERGWCIGHYDGQGHIVCGDCVGAVWEPIPLNVAAHQEAERDHG